MSTNQLRELYFANKIFNIGDIVEDTVTGEEMKIIDRGSNYITVESSSGIKKKWLGEVKTTDIVPDKIEENSDFVILSDGQIRMFAYTTRNFNMELSEDIIEQFELIDDMYSKHQIIKNLDNLLGESADLEHAYLVAEKIGGFYSKNELDEPFILEGMKDQIERKRIVQVIATVAGVELDKSLSKTMENCIAALKKKYTEKKQWIVLYPFLKIAKSMGVTNATTGLPFDIAISDRVPSKDEKLVEQIIELMEESFDELGDPTLEDIHEAFPGEYTDEMINEVLSLSGRQKLARDMRVHSNQLEVKRERALSRAATSSVLQSRARHLAIQQLKTRMFRKPVAQMSRQEKERFEAGASRRKALVARLAQKLVNKVRMLQTARMHAQQTPAHNLGV